MQPVSDRGRVRLVLRDPLAELARLPAGQHGALYQRVSVPNRGCEWQHMQRASTDATAHLSDRHRRHTARLHADPSAHDEPERRSDDSAVRRLKRADVGQYRRERMLRRRWLAVVR